MSPGRTSYSTTICISYAEKSREIEYTVVINRGDVERRIIVVFFNPIEILYPE